MASSYIGTVLCLANSRKMSGHCVAGKALSADGRPVEWIRPVSSRPDKELSDHDVQYSAGAKPTLLDVMNIQFSGRDPHAYQPENHLIDDKAWVWSRRASFAEALSAVDPVQANLWGLSPDSSYHGEYDRVLLADAPVFNFSLKLIHVIDLDIRMSAEGRNFGDLNKRLRGYITYSGHRYALTITDPFIEAKYLPQPEGWFPVGEALICASLGEPYKGHAYKLIAGVILPH